MKRVRIALDLTEAELSKLDSLGEILGAKTRAGTARKIIQDYQANSGRNEELKQALSIIESLTDSVHNLTAQLSKGGHP